jgi:hypothetical protein
MQGEAMSQTLERARKRPLPIFILAGLLAAGLAAVAAIGYSPGTATAAQAQYAPVNTAPPTISGTARVGQTLTASTGTWNGAPTSFAYQWLRCNEAGASCVAIAGATNQTYAVQAADNAMRLRVRVTATNASGSTAADSEPTALVAPAGPAGQTPLPGGGISIPASSVNAPERLIVDRIQFTPNPVRSRAQPVQIRVRIRDTRGFFVRDALVFVRSTPILTSTPPEQATQTDGWVTFNVQPRASFPLRTGFNVQFFVRARKQGDNLLAGVSSRRLVQVRTSSFR